MEKFDNKFEKNIIKEIEHIQYVLKHYIDYTKELETELEYYKNAYENRINKCLQEGDK